MLTKAVVRNVTKVTVERTWMQVAQLHCTKVKIHSENAKPIEMLMFSKERMEIEELDVPSVHPAANESQVA